MAPSIAKAAALLHAHGTTDMVLLQSFGLSRARAKAWNGRAAGTNAYFCSYTANDMEPARRTDYTDDELHCMHFLKSKGCTLPLGIVAATWFPQR